MITIKKIINFVRKNIIIAAFLALILFSFSTFVYRLSFKKLTFIYAKVKLGQGLWWNAPSKPMFWMFSSIKKFDSEIDLLGKPIAQVQSIRYYPWYGGDQYDVILNIKFKVNKDNKTKEYNYKRYALRIGSPVELKLPNVYVTGTIIELSEKEFKDKYIDKTILLTKKNAYPWEYDIIKVGDTYFDGEETVLTILDKKTTSTYVLSGDTMGNYTGNSLEQKQYTTVKVKIKVKEKDGLLMYGEDHQIRPGREVSISTPNVSFNGFMVSEILE